MDVRVWWAEARFGYGIVLLLWAFLLLFFNQPVEGCARGLLLWTGYTMTRTVYLEWRRGPE